MMKTIMLKTIGLVLCSSLLASSAFADWVLNNDNSVFYFVSTKKETISEVHTFKSLSGKITEDGKAELAIDLSSVDTKVDIRNERMQKHFFEIDKFTTATVSLDLGSDGIKPGEADITATLSLHGVEKELPAKVLVMDAEDTITVFSSAPVMVNTDDFELGAGLDMLKKLAALDSINKAVPVTFMLSFDKQ